jgi:hypothetical protein
MLSIVLTQKFQIPLPCVCKAKAPVIAPPKVTATDWRFAAWYRGDRPLLVLRVEGCCAQLMLDDLERAEVFSRPVQHLGGPARVVLAMADLTGGPCQTKLA